MKFEDALNKAYDKIEQSQPELLKDGLLTAEGLKSIAVLWNMLALSFTEKGLDDFVIIRNTNIVSLPLKVKQEKVNVEKEKSTEGKPAKQNSDE